MTFEEKSTLTTTLLLVLVSGAYFTLVLGPVAGSADRQMAFTGLAIGATVVLTILVVVAHVVLALMFRSQATAGRDERDRLIALRSKRLGAHVLAVGVFVTIVLTMLQLQTFWIAQTLIAAWVLAEISEGAAKLVLHRREA